MSDAELRTLVGAIAAGDTAMAQGLIEADPVLATASFRTGASRTAAQSYFVTEVARYVMAGDTALHWAAAAYNAEIIDFLLGMGADIRARNRRGGEPLHDAARGDPDGAGWNPAAQVRTIQALVAAGADPNAADAGGATPLHKAVRSRCADAVDALIAVGADPQRRTGRGSTAERLAQVSSGRSGSGSKSAKLQQAVIQNRLAPEA